MLESVKYDFGSIKVMPCKYDKDYLVYSNGMLYSSKREKFLGCRSNGRNSKYLSYHFYDKGKKIKKVYIHRMIAEHFIENPKNLRDVHHIDNNPRNNDVSNLTWLSHKDNCIIQDKNNIPPLEIIKERERAYVYPFNKKYWKFSYRGRYNNIPHIQKSFKSKEEALIFRDEYFKTHSEVA